MDFDETMVDAEFDDAADDTPEEVIEEEQDESESLDSLTGDEEQPTEESAEEPDEDAAPKATDAGWFKKRISKAVEKAVAETEARMNAQFEQRMAPFVAKMLEDQAQELVRSRKVSDIETARELVRLRSGQPAPAQAPAEPRQEQPRNANGQFAPKTDPAVNARNAMLEHQKEKIDASGGPDVASEFMKNKEIKQKVITGEMDFYDVADYLKEKSSKKKAPSPMRSPNGASGTNPNAIDSMSDEQFARMERKIKEGARYTLR